MASRSSDWNVKSWDRAAEYRKPVLKDTSARASPGSPITRVSAASNQSSGRLTTNCRLSNNPPSRYAHQSGLKDGQADVLLRPADESLIVSSSEGRTGGGVSRGVVFSASIKARNNANGL